MEAGSPSGQGVAGLIASPFSTGQPGDWPPGLCESRSEAHRVVAALVHARVEGESRPVWVSRPADWAETPYVDAIAHLEYVLANDERFKTLHAYVPLPAMRIGATRAVIAVVAERLVFCAFNATLRALLAEILSTPDTGLTAYQVLGPERLDEFGRAFSEDPDGWVSMMFGEPELERVPELAGSLDLREVEAEALGDEQDAASELDETVGVAPGLEPDDDGRASQEDLAGLARDYVIEHVSVHLSPVVARALRVYRERGQVATASELRVTKAPRKTLSALVRLARLSFDEVAILIAELDDWSDVPEEVRHRIVGSLSELRWSLQGDARLLFFAVPGSAPELEDTFASSGSIEWTFEAFRTEGLLTGPPNAATAERWVKAATLPGWDGPVMEPGVLDRLIAAAGDSFEDFIARAEIAFDHAGARGASTVGSKDVDAALSGLQGCAEGA